MRPNRTFVLYDLIAVVGLFLAASRCSTIPRDPSPNAAGSGDMTIQFQTPGTVSQKGYLFLQKREESPLVDQVAMIIPALHCSHNSCAQFQFFRKDGSPGFAGSIPAGADRAQIPISAIVGHAGNVSNADDGEYDALIQLFYTGPKGQDYSTVMNGFVRLNVVAKDYDPLACNAPMVAWKVAVSPRCEAQFTTTGRSAACGSGCL